MKRMANLFTGFSCQLPYMPFSYSFLQRAKRKKKQAVIKAIWLLFQ